MSDFYEEVRLLLVRRDRGEIQPSGLELALRSLVEAEKNRREPKP